MIIVGVLSDDSDKNNELVNTVKLLREQVDAFIYNRQADYNALEESLKLAMEKNTELTVLKNEVKQLRKEVGSLSGGSGNEAKNERLRVKWLGSAVTELKNEFAEVLRMRNASEELAQRGQITNEIALLRGDVEQVGRGVRDLGGRLTQIEASIGAIKADISAVKERAGQVTRNCADVASQLSTVQIEMKTLKYDENLEKTHQLSRNEIKKSHENDYNNENHHSTRHSLSRLSILKKIEERLNHVEHKIAIVSRKRGMIEKRVVYEKSDKQNDEIINNIKNELTTKITNISDHIIVIDGIIDDLKLATMGTVETIEDKIEQNVSVLKRELVRLDVNAAKKNAELSLTREELGSLRRTIQALSVSASKLQEKSDKQQNYITKLDKNIHDISILNISIDKAINATHELEHVEDEYRLMVDALPGNCDERDGLTLLRNGQGMPLLVSCHSGWIVVAKRVDGIVDFDKTWNEYAIGFGSPINEFWVGNEALHRLTRDNCTKLKIDLIDIYGTKWIAEYNNFIIGSEDTGYRIQISGYSGNATDALSYQNGMSFSAKDKDMDISTADCAANYHGGWWFSNCQHANLNAKYSLGLTWYQNDSNEWMAVSASTMSIQKKQHC